MSRLNPAVRGPAARGRRWRPGGLAFGEALTGYLFVSPWVIGFILFTLVPMAAALYFSLTDFDLRRPDDIHFVGLDNYVRLLGDRNVHVSVWVTLRFLVLSVPLTLIAALGVAVLLNSRNVVGRTLLRTLFYMPMQIPLVASTLIWAAVLNSQTGWVNRGLAGIGVEGPDWIGDPGWVLVTFALLGLWGIGNAMLVFIAGLQGVPTELYDAAKVDGAGGWTRFRRITLPLITPVIFYNLLIGLVVGFQYFIQAYVLKNGIPDDSTLFFNVNLYREAFTFNQLGYASALAWVLFLVILSVTIVLLLWSRRWVYYAAER